MVHPKYASDRDAHVPQALDPVNDAFDGAGFVTFEVSDSDRLVIKASTESDVTISGLDTLGLDGTITYINGTSVTGTVSDIYQTVFEGAADTAAPGIADYTQAVDDARAIIDYVHTYSAPE